MSSAMHWSSYSVPTFGSSFWTSELPLAPLETPDSLQSERGSVCSPPFPLMPRFPQESLVSIVLPETPGTATFQPYLAAGCFSRTSGWSVSQTHISVVWALLERVWPLYRVNMVNATNALQAAACCISNLLSGFCIMLHLKRKSICNWLQSRVPILGHVEHQHHGQSTSCSMISSLFPALTHY